MESRGVMGVFLLVECGSLGNGRPKKRDGKCNEGISIMGGKGGHNQINHDGYSATNHEYPSDDITKTI